MRHFIKILSLILSVVFLITMCSCSLFTYDTSRFDGGDTLSDELLSKIENDLRNEAQTSETTNDSKATEDIHSDLSVESESQDNKDGDTTVYWTSGGSVWHTSRECSYIKNSKNILSGTVDEAISSGKKQLCSSCQKH